MLEKEIDKRKFKDKIHEGELKIQIKQLSLNLNKERTAKEELQS